MLRAMAKLAIRITAAGLVIGAGTAIIGIAAIGISELISRRREGEDDLFDDYPLEAGPTGAPQELDEEFLSLLACPVCKTNVRREGERLVCATCGRRYPIREGIPVMLVEEAEMPSSGAARPT